MKLLKLSNSMNKVTLIDDEDFLRCLPYVWFIHINENLYESIHASVDGVPMVSLSRFILNDFTSQTIDHQDRNPFNCQKSNLRSATFVENARNRGLSFSNTSGYKGISYYKDRKVWAAQIYLNGKNKYLGSYKTPEEAALAYNKAAKKYFKVFAFLNVVKEK